VAHFDRAIPAGGEGKITLKLNLKGYQGNVKKTATVFTNDPLKSRFILTMQGIVKSLIEVRPTSIVSFRGLADQLPEQTIDLESTTQAFHIQKVESTLEDKVAYQLETVEDGKHYRLKVSNKLKQGNYNGYIKCFTDVPQKSEILIRITGFIEGEVAVRPQTILVGKLGGQQASRTGKVVVVNNRKKPFHISKLNYDERLIRVAQTPIPNETGISLEITPIMENIPSGSRQQTTITIETDINPAETYQVAVHVVHTADTATAQPAPGGPQAQPPTEESAEPPDTSKPLIPSVTPREPEAAQPTKAPEASDTPKPPASPDSSGTPQQGSSSDSK